MVVVELDVEALRTENAALRGQITGLVEQVAGFVEQIAKLNERVAELLAVAQRKQRKPATPAVASAPVEVHNFEVAGEHNYFVGGAGVLVHNGGSQSFDDYNQARNAALKWLEPRGFVAERQVIGRFGAIAGKPIGMSTADGRVGFRVEFDSRSGAHINVWDYNAAKGMQKGDHYTFKGSRKTMNRIARQFGCR